MATNPTPTDPMNFKFHWVDEEGNTKGMFATKGHFDGEMLHLGKDDSLPVAAFAEVESRNHYLLFAVAHEDGPIHLILYITSQSLAQKLKEAIGRARSAIWAEQHRKELNEAGRGHEFRAVHCPYCQATIDLTGFPETPQVSCMFCHSLATLADSTAYIPGESHREQHYQLCEECGMYSKPRKFTIFYFYFLLVVYGYYQNETWRCPACMRGEAWKMLFGNLLFVIGVPVALVQLFRAYGGTSVGEHFPGLDAANLKARNGNLEAAVGDYQKLMEKRPVSAGVKYNIGLACLNKDDLQSASRILEYALQDCANYQPAASLLIGCYNELGETQKAAELKRVWEVEEDQTPEVN